MLILYTIDTYLEFQWISPLSSVIVSGILHLLGMLAILEISLQIKSDDVQACVSVRMQQYFK